MRFTDPLLPINLFLSISFAFPTYSNKFDSRDDASALALITVYPGDNCDYPPYYDLILDFETVDQCIGNGTVARGVAVSKLAEGCVVNVYTNQDCTGVKYALSEVACWVEFTVDNEDVGVRGAEVSCSTLASNTSTTAAAAAATTTTATTAPPAAMSTSASSSYATYA